MREIKFRVWNTTHKRMDWAMQVFGNKIIQDKYNIVLQYTGLKDKNGKEIYEGDILKFKIDRFVFVVGFGDNLENNSYGFNLTSGKNVYALEKSVNKSEIIGNIYENKELLEEKK